MDYNYDYLTEMTNDIMRFIDEEDYELSTDSDWEKLEDRLWAESSITGNGEDGWYFEYDEDAIDAVHGSQENRKLLVGALRDFGDSPADYRRAIQEPGYADCTIRCYLLSQAIQKVREKYEEEMGK